MTNEELTALIKEGRTDLIVQLWRQVERLVWIKAISFARRHENDIARSGVEQSDLYQSGFFALLRALETYDPVIGCKFTTHLDLCLKTAFADTCGWRTKRTNLDPLSNCASLDEPINSDEGAETSLKDAIEDVSAQDGFLEIERAEFRKKIHEIIEALPEPERDAIRKRYFKEKTLDQHERILERNALRLLRHPRLRNALSAYARS